MANQRLIHYAANTFEPEYASRLDGFLYAVIGVIVFGVIGFFGSIANQSMMMRIYAAPIVVICFILMIIDLVAFYRIWKEKSSVVNAKEQESTQ